MAEELFALHRGQIEVKTTKICVITNFDVFAEEEQSEQVSISPPPPIREVPQGYDSGGPRYEFSEYVDG
jgi:hypothetical protein